MKRLLVFVLFTFNCYSQSPVFFNLSDNINLPNKTIYDVIEDNQKFIWLATDIGIYRYDGKDFKLFSHPKQIGLSVFNLSLDNNNVLWFNNLSNQLFFIEDNKKPQLFINLNNEFKGENTQINLSDEYVLVSGIRSIVVLNKKTKKIIATVNKGLKNSNIRPFILNNILYVLQEDFSWFKFNLKTLSGTKEEIYLKRDKKSWAKSGAMVLRGNNSWLIIENRRKQLTITAFNNNLINELIIKGGFSKKRIISANIIDEDLWVSAEDGLYIYTINENQVELKKHLFKDKLITKSIKDVLGNYWVASHDMGVFIIPNITFNKIEIPSNFLGSKNHFNGSKNFYIQSLQNKIFKIDISKKSFKRLPRIFNEDVKFIFDNPENDNFYINNLTDGLLVFNKDLRFLKTIEYNGVLKDVNFISSNVVLSSANINSKIFDITKKNNESYNLGFRSFINSERSYSNIFHKKKHTAYFANINGLFSVDTLGNKREILNNGEKIFAKKLVKDSLENIWSLGFKNSILKISNDTVTKELNLKNGLLSSINNYIYTYKNNLWILGNKGIQIYNPKKDIFKNITKKDGLSSYDFKGIFIKDDTAFVSLSKSIIYFDINKFKEKNRILNPYITKIVNNDKIVDLTSKFNFSSTTNKLDFYFNTNGLYSKETVKYTYKINNSNWQNLTEGSNVISFNSISSGTYDLSIKANYGNQVSKPIHINFTIKKPFYKMWFFILGVVFVLVFFIWFFLNRKSARIQKEQQLKLDKQNQELENINLKLENLRSQMNPHFIFNALNSIQDYILKNETTLARHFLIKFSRLIRIYLEHTQEDQISLSEEIEALKLYLDLEKDRFSKDFNYTINVDPIIKVNAINLPPFLIQPYVENAIKHGLMHKKGAKELEVNFYFIKDSVFCCEIIDNGIGYKKSSQLNQKKAIYKSFSTNANQKRITLLNKTLRSKIQFSVINVNDNLDNTGTKVTIKIPQ